MVKDESIGSPLQRIKLEPEDIDELKAVADAIFEANFERYHEFTDVDGSKVNSKMWRYIKSKDHIKIYAERRQKRRRSGFWASHMDDGNSELQSMLCYGSTPGTLDDIMMGILRPTIESTHTQKSCIDARSGSAVLSIAKAPSAEDPFESVVVSWMELNFRRRSMGMVKNRDYVYVEATGIKLLPNGSRLGYRLMHSVDFPQSRVLEGRVRAKLSVCCFFRQQNESSVSVYTMWMMESMTESVRRLVVPRFVKQLLIPLKYAHYREMNKLTQALGERFAELKTTKSRDPDHSCSACNKHLGRLGKLLGHYSTCKRCFKYVCNSCKVDKKISFVTLDLKMAHRNVTFCPSCGNDAAIEVLPELPHVEICSQIAIHRRQHSDVSSVSSGWGTMLEDDPQPILL